MIGPRLARILPRRGRGGVCQVHGYHWPPITGTERHHVWPKGMGGVDEPWNVVEACPNGHTNIHNRMAWLLTQSSDLATSFPEPKVTREEDRLARLGILWWVAHGKPGDAHAAYALSSWMRE